MLCQIWRRPAEAPKDTVTACGRICIRRRKVNLSGAFAGQNVGIKEVAEKIWVVSCKVTPLGH